MLFFDSISEILDDIIQSKMDPSLILCFLMGIIRLIQAVMI